MRCELPQGKTLTLEVTDSNDKKVVLEGRLLVSRAWNGDGGSGTLESDAALGYYNINRATGMMGNGSFYVEEYKKPEYQVTVKVPVPHLLQGKFDSGEY